MEGKRKRKRKRKIESKANRGCVQGQPGVRPPVTANMAADKAGCGCNHDRIQDCSWP